MQFVKGPLIINVLFILKHSNQSPNYNHENLENKTLLRLGTLPRTTVVIVLPIMIIFLVNPPNWALE